MQDYDAIRRELERYRPDLLKRREVLLLSKGDLIHDETLLDDLNRKLAERGLEAMRISAASAQGIDVFVQKMFDAVEGTRRDAERSEKGD